MSNRLMVSVRTLGFLILVLGAWGAIVPFAGPAFGYPMPPGSQVPAWSWTAQHAELHVAAGGAAFIGGLLLMVARSRGAAVLGGLTALLGGAWFVLGPIFSPAFSSGGAAAAGPASTFMHIVTPLGYHYGTGLVIALLAGLALGMLPRGVRGGAMEERTVADRYAVPGAATAGPPVASPYGRQTTAEERRRDRELVGTR